MCQEMSTYQEYVFEITHVDRGRNRARINTFDKDIPLLVDDAAKITENGAEHGVDEFDFGFVDGE